MTVTLDVLGKSGLRDVLSRHVDSGRIPGLVALVSRGEETYVEAIGILVRELGEIPLIGFAGAPFTLASYLIEGGPSRNHERTKALMKSAPEVWHALLGRIADYTLAFLNAQVAAGIDAMQLFDSWAGALSERDYREYVFPHSQKVLAGLAYAGIPRI
ncbi:uroporphyrinogen decarboxylase family protein, partial [Kibdelosporangium lantanae]